MIEIPITSIKDLKVGFSIIKFGNHKGEKVVTRLRIDKISHDKVLARRHYWGRGLGIIITEQELIKDWKYFNYIG